MISLPNNFMVEISNKKTNWLLKDLIYESGHMFDEKFCVLTIYLFYLGVRGRNSKHPEYLNEETVSLKAKKNECNSLS